MKRWNKIVFRTLKFNINSLNNMLSCIENNNIIIN